MSILNTSTSPFAARLPQPPREVGSVTPPDLDDEDLYIVKRGVPILQAHTYKERKVVNGEPRTIVREIDEARLNLIVENSNRRAASGDYGLVFLGHTDDDKPEDEQPPIVGYMRNYRVGEWAGKPCVLADLYVEKARKSEVATFPRRSAETWYHETEPDRNYIDAVSLLRRTPEQALGLLTFSRSEGTKLRFAAIDDSQLSTSEDTMALSDEDYSKIGEIISTSLQTSLKSLSEHLAVTIQHAVKTVLDGAAQEGEGEEVEDAVDDGASEEQNSHDEPDGDEAPEDAEPDSEDAETPPSTGDDEEESNEKNEAGSTPSGSNTSVPGEIGDEDGSKESMCADPDKMNDEGTKERNRMRKESEGITLARYEKRLNSLETEVKTLRTENATLQRNARNSRRERDLIQLEAEGYEVDRAQELEDGDGFDDARWSKHLDKIRARYSRKPIDADEVPVVKERPGVPGEDPDEDLTPEQVAADRAGLLKFSRDNAGKFRNEIEAVAAWKQHKAEKKAAKA